MDANIREKFKRIYNYQNLPKKQKRPKNKNECPDCKIEYRVDKTNAKKVCNECGRCIPHYEDIRAPTEQGVFMLEYDNIRYFREKIKTYKLLLIESQKLLKIFTMNYDLMRKIFTHHEIRKINYSYVISKLMLYINRKKAFKYRYKLSNKVILKYDYVWLKILSDKSFSSNIYDEY